MLRGRFVVVVVVLVGLVSACGLGPSRHGRAYVAIGDSYVSGPALGGRLDPNARVCQRSDRNYPHLVAKDLKNTKLVDVSCGGATTATVNLGRTAAQGGVLKPQLDALTSKTKLVTVGIGANDGGLLLGMFVSCLVKASATDPKCANFANYYAPNLYPLITSNVAKTLSKIKQLAPNARVLLVGYLRIVPDTDSGVCPALPITVANRANALKIEVALTQALREAAATADVSFVDVRGISDGHDACAGKNAWVNGTVNVPSSGAILHPTEAGMHAVAGQVAKAVGHF
jgi:lysophospholipase L1-like esterase